MEYAMLYFVGPAYLEKNIGLNKGDGVVGEVPRIGKTMAIPIRGEATIGSDPRNYIVIEDRVISKNHAKIVFRSDEGECYLQALESRSGTYLKGCLVPNENDAAYSKEEKTPILFGHAPNNDVIEFSQRGYKFKFEVKIA